MPVGEVMILFLITLAMAFALTCAAIVLSRPDREAGNDNYNGRQSPYLNEKNLPSTHWDDRR
jgi:hypothetical protein